MPIIQVTMLKGRTLEQKRQLVKEVTDAVERTVNARREKIKIVITEVDKEHIADAGVLFSDM